MGPRPRLAAGRPSLQLPPGRSASPALVLLALAVSWPQAALARPSAGAEPHALAGALCLGRAGPSGPAGRAGMPASSAPGGCGWDVGVEELQERARALVQLVEAHQFLVQSHVTDFYTESLWETLPADWRAVFEGLPPAVALHLISLSSDPAAQLELLQSRGSVPHSLAGFLQQLATLPLPRQPSPEAPQVPEDAAARPEGADGAWCGFKAGEGLTRGMTPKKLHEVEKLASFVSTTVAAGEASGSAGCCGGAADGAADMPAREVVMVDIGSGQGYLSRVLVCVCVWV